jgi:nucleoid DNA-binding protein
VTRQEQDVRVHSRRQSSRIVARKLDTPAQTQPNSNSGKQQLRQTATQPNKPGKQSAKKETGDTMTMAAAKANPLKEKYTKNQILTDLSDKTGLSKKEVGVVLDELTSLIERHVKKKSVGEFTLPGLLKISTVHKKAQKARKGINPFTKEEQMFKAKPARTVVKVRPLKKLKAMVE